MIIYKITNTVNGKVYIGQTVQDLKERWYGHCSKSSECPAIKNAIKKYGKENFTVEQIDSATTQDELNRKEEHWIDFYDSMNKTKGYNLTSGGEHPNVTEEFRRKCSERHKGEKCYWYGRPFSEEHRANISRANTGKKASEETRRKQSEARKGKKFSEEHRRKLSESLKGHSVSDEVKNRLRECATGRKHKPETLKKMSEMRTRGKSPRAKKVLCVETGEIFVCGRDASEVKSCNYVHLTECCRNKRNTCGGYHWQYIDK